MDAGCGGESVALNFSHNDKKPTRGGTQVDSTTGMGPGLPGSNRFPSNRIAWLDIRYCLSSVNPELRISEIHENVISTVSTT